MNFLVGRFPVKSQRSHVNRYSLARCCLRLKLPSLMVSMKPTSSSSISTREAVDLEQPSLSPSVRTDIARAIVHPVVDAQELDHCSTRRGRQRTPCLTVENPLFEHNEGQ